jgi:tRNA-2-methylthio-N6-dimethylallyladenosine synthase
MTHNSPEAKKAYVETYGCQMNISDGELMQGILAAQGYEIVGTPEAADVVLVNTCAIRDHAEQRVLGRVGELYNLKRQRPDLLIGVTGCMAQRLGEKLQESAPYVDLVMGPDGYRKLPETLARLHDAAALANPGTPARARRSLPVLSGSALQELVPAARWKAPAHAAVLDFEAAENYEDLEIRRSSRLTAWVPVQRGCNYRCTYCIVPYTRGPEKNRAPDRILEEVRQIVAQGIPEVTLLGQTVNSYEHDGWDFSRLLRAVARVPGMRRVRFTSPHPNDFVPSLVDVMAEEPAVCKQLHLPLQSGSDRTLKRMLRRYTVASYLEKIRLVRERIPDIVLSTDIIVGFPGETEEDFQATLDILGEVRYDDAFLYKYSLRDGTPATRLPGSDFIPDAVAQTRLERVIELHRSIQNDVNRAQLGAVVEVLVERAARSAGDVLGRTDGNKVVAFLGSPELIGRFMHVRLTGTTGATFSGEAVQTPAFSTRVA